METKGKMTRDEMLDRLRSGETWDLLVIGGGATGLGAAVDAASRGYRTLLLEAYDFAKGTSSRSTKLVHGGVRYLAQGQIGLVHEALHERGLLRQNAPHLVHDLEFVVPAYRWWARPYYGAGLWMYDLLAGRARLGASRLVGRAETLARLPTLKTEGLRGGVVYTDGQFDDARLAVALMRTAVELGAVVLNYLPVEALVKANGRLTGAVARNAETGETFQVSARAVVNATGVFADAVRTLDDPHAEAIIAPSQGIHLVLDRHFLPGSSALMVPSTDDGRVLFAIPWNGKTLLGTTDTPVARTSVEPRPLDEEIDYLLRHAARYFARPPGPADVLSMYAGLRPLVKARHPTQTSRLSREHTLLVAPSGLVTITGGKWTTYRPMAAETVDRAAEVAGLLACPSPTATLRLHGWTASAANGPFPSRGADEPEVARLAAERPEWQRPLHPRLEVKGVDVVWAARHEGARTVEDVLARRSRALLLDASASQEAAPAAAALLAAELGRDEAWQSDQVRQFQELADGYILKK